MVVFMRVFIAATLTIIVTADVSISNEECDRRPLRTKANPLPPDGRFQISVEGIIEDKYIPKQKYAVVLSTDSESTFIAFTISVKEDSTLYVKNTRKPKPMLAGDIYPSPDNDDAKFSDTCKNTVIQSNITPKKYVQVSWMAPPENQGCVTIYAVVAVKPDVWYSNEGPLIKKICEDQRQKDDMQPPLNNNCTICEEARYLLTFQGVWVYNTHMNAFPENKKLARFSDLVGASHNNNFELWKYNKEASVGLKRLAEQGNTTELETEIQKQYRSSGNTGVRTILKAKGQTDPNEKTYAIFRASRYHHRLSLVASILPSPDWFLGVSNFELCDGSNNWATNITLNLYPLDAGTDSGVNFESPNDETSPAQPINKAKFKSPDGTEVDVKPFAKMKLDLIRTYEQDDCTENEDKNGDDSTETPSEGIVTSTAYESLPETSSEAVYTPRPLPPPGTKCPITEWEDWLPCSGECVDGKIEGYQTRERYHLVDGIAVDKYEENIHVNNNKEVPYKCRQQHISLETRECQEEGCQDEAEDNRTWKPVAPGRTWNPK